MIWIKKDVNAAQKWWKEKKKNIRADLKFKKILTIKVNRLLSNMSWNWQMGHY